MLSELRIRGCYLFLFDFLNYLENNQNNMNILDVRQTNVLQYNNLNFFKNNFKEVEDCLFIKE